jgi:anti-sigma regulatory factor (Ser/Thr protein kinase)
VRELVLVIDDECAASARAFVQGWLEEAGTGEDESFDMLLALNEAVGNACRHAFPDGQAGEVTIRCDRNGSELLLTVSDEGEGFDFRPEMFEMPDALSQRGRGFFMMRELTDSVNVNSDRLGTIVTLRRRVSVPVRNDR